MFLLGSLSEPNAKYATYTRHTSRCLCVIFSHSPQSLMGVGAWGLINPISEVQPAAQRKHGSNQFPTDFSLRCLLPVTQII